ncbi:MAG TPA: translocation/assembly module TamB domain-containing protein [Anaeromyxobacter sp.]|nr:translocation/assembly module TamB domain-containing protein [Anaeromyxobacter sp.]
MRRALARAVATAGWAALGLAAFLGVALAALSFLATAPFSRAFVAARVVAILDDAIAGHVTLQSIEVLPGGGMELRGLEISDPEGHLVLSVGRARVAADVTGLRRRAVGISVELDAPSVMLEEERGGGVSIARAFAPARPSAPREQAERGGGGGWTIYVSRLAIRRGDVWWVDAENETRLEATALDVDARGLWGPERARVELRLGGSLDVPAGAPVSLELAGGRDGAAVRVPVLRAQLGRTAVALLGEADLARRAGRLAVTRADLSRDLARAVAPAVPPGGDLDATAYAESDGTTLTAALHAEPAGGDAGGRADAAAALTLREGARALGFDVAIDRLDPSRLAADAPAGEITLTARGAAAGRSLKELRGRVDARLQRSRLRGGDVHAAELVARADRGTVDVSRATLSAPGLSLDAAGRWRDGGAVGGRVSADASDLAVLARNAGKLLGTRPAAVAGRARIEGTFGGTTAAPTAAATVDAPAFRIGGIALSGARLALEGAGPVRAVTARVEGRIAAVRSGGTDVAHAVSLSGALAEGAGSLDATATVPGFDEPARIEARGQLSRTLETLALSSFALSYPGSRWTLAGPAVVSLAGPSVDRLALVEKAQAIVLTGGLDARGGLDVRASVTRLDLARLPPGLAPETAGLRGEVSADVRATGRSAKPQLAATFTLAGGAVRDLAGIAAVGSASWSGVTRRAGGSISIARADGTVDLAADVPLPLAGRPAEAVRVTARAASLPVRDLLATAGAAPDAAGLLSLDGVVEGTVGAPALRLTAALADARWRDLDGLAVEASADDGGERLAVTARVSLHGAEVASARAELPLDLSDLLVRPAAAARAARTAPLAGSAAVTGLELASVSGRAGVPAAIAGRVDAAATLSGSIARPRGDATLDLAGGAWAGYRDLGARAAVSLANASSSVSGRVVLAGDEAIRIAASLAAPPERLATAAALRAAPLQVEVVAPRLALERTGTKELPLAGTVSARLTATGTLGAPVATLVAQGEGVAVKGRPLGKARLDASHARARTTASLAVTPPTGGTLDVTAALEAELGLGARRARLADAPAELAVKADAVDLSVLAALFPGRVRSAGGTLTADASARGPLARLAPRGTLRVRDGRVAIVEYGELSGITVDAAATEHAIEVTRLEVRRGKGRVTATAALRDRSSEKARLEARLEAEAFTISRAGMPVGTLDLRADATGTWEKRTLSTDVTIPRGVIRLPDRQPRPLQPIEERKDIVIGRPERPVAGRAVREEEPGLGLVVHVLVPRSLFVKGDDPRTDVELKADVTYERSAGQDYARGYVETVRGTVEPIAGRTFTIERGRVQFTGGPPSAATLDVEAKYTSPAAVVTAKIVGPLERPDINLTSQPPMDEAQIALLIATGQRELKAGTASVGTMTGAEAGKAALGAVATTAFRELVANKLPIDTFSFDSGAVRAGKYVTDKIYVGYVRRFEADPARGENPDEVRVEYQITPRWNFESRYGTAQSGGASLIWSKDF